jgi:hypothetical protein
LAGILAHLASQSRNRVETGVARLDEPPLDGRARKLHGLARNRVTPCTQGEPFDLARQLPSRWWRGQKRPYHGKA